MRAELLRAEVERIDNLLGTLVDRARSTSRDVLSRIPNHRELPQSELGRRFAEEVASSPIRLYLQWAKNDKLSLERLKRHLTTPGEALRQLQLL